MINADFSWLIRIYHNYQRHPRSIVFVVYLLRVPKPLQLTSIKGMLSVEAFRFKFGSRLIEPLFN